MTSPDVTRLQPVAPGRRRRRARRHPPNGPPGRSQPEVGEVAHRRQGAIDGVPLEAQVRERLAAPASRPRPTMPCVESDHLRCAPRGQQRGDRRVERTPGPLPHHPDRALGAAHQVLESSVPRHVDDAHGQWDLARPRPLPGTPVPSQRSLDASEQRADGRPASRAGPTACRATSQKAATCSRKILGPRGSPRASLQGPHRRRAVRGCDRPGRVRPSSRGASRTWPRWRRSASAWSSPNNVAARSAVGGAPHVKQ